MTRRTNVAPRQKLATKARRDELREMLLTLAMRLTPAGTMKALAKRLGCGNDRFCGWIKYGTVPPWRSAQILKLPNANPRGAQQITLADLTPNLYAE